MKVGLTSNTTTTPSGFRVHAKLPSVSEYEPSGFSTQPGQFGGFTDAPGQSA